MSSFSPPQKARNVIDQQRNRTLLTRLSFLALLLIVVGLAMAIPNQFSGVSLLFFSLASVVILGLGAGFIAFLDRYPPAKGAGNALLWVGGVLLVVLAGEIYFIIWSHALGDKGTIEKFGSLGDSFGPLSGIFTGGALLFSILTNRSQSHVEEQQTRAIKKQAKHQKAQAEELSKNNSLYLHMILAQRMSTASQIRTRLAELHVERLKFIRENSMQGKVSSVIAVRHNMPYNNRADFEIEQLELLLAIEVDMIKKLTKEVGIAEEEFTSIKQWAEIISRPLKLQQGASASGM